MDLNDRLPRPMHMPVGHSGGAIEKLATIYQMSLENFFSVSRLLRLGVPQNIAVRISNAMDKQKTVHKNMRQFLLHINQQHPNAPYEIFFRILPNMGKTSAEHLMRVFEMSGIQNIRVELAEAQERVRIAHSLLDQVIKITNNVAVKDAWSALARAEAELEQITEK